MVVVDRGGGVSGSKKAYNIHPQESDTLVIIIIIIIIIINHLCAGYSQLCTHNLCL